MITKAKPYSQSLVDIARPLCHRFDVLTNIVDMKGFLDMKRFVHRVAYIDKQGKIAGVKACLSATEHIKFWRGKNQPVMYTVECASEGEARAMKKEMQYGWDRHPHFSTWYLPGINEEEEAKVALSRKNEKLREERRPYALVVLTATTCSGTVISRCVTTNRPCELLGIYRDSYLEWDIEFSEEFLFDSRREALQKRDEIHSRLEPVNSVWYGEYVG